MADSVEEIKKAQKLYILIGLVLFVFTVVTVAVATVPALDFGEHGFDSADMKIGLAIATFKASLVGFIFMHLNHEKKAIYWVFGLGIFMGLMLILLTGFHYADPIKYGDPLKGDGFYNPAKPEQD